MKLSYFRDISFLQAIKALFNELNVPVNYVADEPTSAQVILKDTYKENSTFQLVDEVYFVGMVDDAAFEGNKSLAVEKIKSDYDGILIFGVSLNQRENNLLPTRSQLAEISRAFNREFYYTPVVLVFKYADDKGQYIAFANTERLQYKQAWREGEKAGKVSLLRDIDLQRPHRGHEDIINQLRIQTSGTKAVDTFAKLYAYWQEVFSVSVLNKRFYQELSNWYFWAVKQVTFPDKPTEADAIKKNAKLDDLIQEHNATNVIRLLTRLLFTWFIKEKKLIPEELFDLEALQKDILNDIAPYHENGLFNQANKESVYYRAILQNLFFASLNCPIKPDGTDSRERGFRGDGYGTHRGIDYLMRYKKYFKNPNTFLELMNKTVPFLNGGLFECLDDKYSNTYIDGFSDQMTKGEQLIVPDYLFFGTPEEVDLSTEYGVNNNTTKKAAVKGLINILKSYKFTITENTPIEEDVALDPELLGKVFENLLASYNPETKTTARKQTGSFYTPREIVNYMVDESLIAYLKNAVSDWEMDEKQIDDKLHQLASFDAKNPFVENQKLTRDIVSALDRCKILDPACGSGAFPMGVLQKMVHMLQKLDPENFIWKEVQIQKVQEETSEVFKTIDDKAEREEKLKEINNAFDQRINDPDYARKLYLIENCIYGVDIQPIATQISKLRFFISLVVDQKSNTKIDENFGIRPLPNLETKFVTANTLIGINKEANLFTTDTVKDLEKQLKHIRHKLFSARTKDTKLKYRQKDEELRKVIAEELKNQGLPVDSAEKLAKWDPYDQNASSPFFDPEWMFDIAEGFDVVIGNPPYKIVKSTNTEKSVLKEYLKYYTADFKVNLYALFLERSLTLGKNSTSIHNYIIPDTSLNLPAFKKLRDLLALKNRLLRISYYDEKVFENAEVGKSIILNYQKNISLSKIEFFHFSSIEKAKKTTLDIDKIKSDSELRLVLKESNTSNMAFEMINSIETKISNFCDVYDGINPGSKELKDVFINTQKLTHSKKVIDGKDFNKFTPIEWSGIYVQYDENLVELERNKLKKIGKPFTARIIKKTNFFEKNKVITRQTSDTIIATLDEVGYYTKNSVHSTLIKKEYKNILSLKIICSLYNSKLIDWFYRTKSMESGRLFPQVKIERLNDLPVPSKEILINKKLVLELLCSFLLYKYSLKLQEVLDAVVFNLYFPDHMQEREIDVLQFVERDLEKVIQGKEFEKLSDTEKEQVIEQLHQTWSHPDSEVRNRIKLFAVRSPEILKPILES
jgi:hypothetical protein